MDKRFIFLMAIALVVSSSAKASPERIALICTGKASSSNSVNHLKNINRTFVFEFNKAATYHTDNRKDPGVESTITIGPKWTLIEDGRTTFVDETYNIYSESVLKDVRFYSRMYAGSDGIISMTHTKIDVNHNFLLVDNFFYTLETVPPTQRDILINRLDGAWTEEIYKSKTTNSVSERIKITGKCVAAKNQF